MNYVKVKKNFWNTCGGCGASDCVECNSGGQHRIAQEGIGACEKDIRP